MNDQGKRLQFKNTFLTTLILLLTATLISCANVTYYNDEGSASSELNEVPKGKARIIFVQRRGSGDLIEYPAAPIFDGNELVGILPEFSYFYYDTTPGEHVFGVFFPRDNSSDFVRGDLEEGKTYYIYVKRIFAFIRSFFSLIAAKDNDPELDQIKKSLPTLKYAKINAEGIENYKSKGTELDEERIKWIEKANTTSKTKL